MLDLFAGSGALGLEALSRGAPPADFVELSAAVARGAPARTSTRSGVEARSRIHRGDALRFAGRLAPGAFDLAFADPPYARDDAAELVAPLPPDAVCPHSGGGASAPTLALAGDDTRRYGDTALTFCYAP